MDYSILYVLGIPLFTIVFVVGVVILKKRKIITNDDLLFACKVLDLTLPIIDELNLTKEKYIKTISQIVIDSVEFAITIDGDKDKTFANAFEYAIEKCEVLGIELNDSRMKVIEGLLEIGLNNRYALV